MDEPIVPTGQPDPTPAPQPAAPQPAAQPTPDPAPAPQPEPAPNPAPNPAPEPKPEPAAPTELGDLYFKGDPVDVEIPEGLSNTLSEAGVDVNKVVSELYAKDGDFSLSADTRAALDAKFGAVVVDTYLSALKAQNELAVTKFSSEREAASKAEQESVDWSNEQVGGEEAWTAMSTWAAETLTGEEVDNFNTAMQSGSRYIQQLAIQSLKQKWSAEAGDFDYSLIQADNATSTDSLGGPLSSREYIDEISKLHSLRGAERLEAERKLDQRRRAGIARGM